MSDQWKNNTSPSYFSRVASVMIVLVAFGVGYGLGNGITFTGDGNPFNARRTFPNPDESAGELDEFEAFWEVWNRVEDNFFFDLPDVSHRTEGAIDGMLSSLDDRFTRYIPPASAELMREEDSGEFEGIGAFVGEADGGGVLILRLFANGPAEEAGVLKNDTIIAIDGEPIIELDLDTALMLVRGPANSEVRLTVVREGVDDPFELVVTRRRLDVPTTEIRLLDNEVGYVLLFEFNQQADRRMRQAIDDLLDQGAEAIILDLRDNPGGFLNEAVGVADLFLPTGEVLTQRDIDGQSRSHRSDNGDAAEEVPLVVLVNGGSASASEIVAGAIQDLERGILIGEQTFGKGSVQLQFDISGGGILRVTTAAWFTPNGNTINGIGIMPDIEVAAGEDDASDPQLEAALDYLQSAIVDIGQ